MLQGCWWKSLNDGRTAQISLGLAAMLFEGALFDIDDDEGICGRSGRFGEERKHIGSLGFRPDDVSVSFTGCRTSVRNRK